MAGQSRKLAIVVSPAARWDFREIWLWNAANKSPDQADVYEQFLEAEIDKLATDYAGGRHVPGVPEFMYVTVMRSTGGHGHYVVYQVTEDSVEILCLFHTRQNWINRLVERR